MTEKMPNRTVFILNFRPPILTRNKGHNNKKKEKNCCAQLYVLIFKLSRRFMVFILPIRRTCKTLDKQIHSI